jgi:hypothetical protein
MNHGVLLGFNPSGKDFVAGTLPYEVVIESGSHLKWIPTNEPQSYPAPETERWNCVTQAHHNQVENIMMRDIELGRMPKTHEQWLRDSGYFDDNGKINFAEAFNSILNETVWNNPDTSKNGNYVWKVCEDGRKISGLIPARMLPDVPSMKNAEYYNRSRITPEMIAIGQEFMKWFNLPYEWQGVEPAEIRKQLKQVPLMITQPGHEVVGVNHKPTAIVTNDSYDPYIKDLPYTGVNYVMKVLVNYLEREPMSNVIFVHKEGTPEYGFFIPATTVDTLKDKALNFGLSITKPDGSVDFDKAKGVKFNA